MHLSVYQYKLESYGLSREISTRYRLTRYPTSTKTAVPPLFLPFCSSYRIGLFLSSLIVLKFIKLTLFVFLNLTLEPIQISSFYHEISGNLNCIINSLHNISSPTIITSWFTIYFRQFNKYLANEHRIRIVSKN